jgi:hypothetical protein
MSCYAEQIRQCLSLSYSLPGSLVPVSLQYLVTYTNIFAVKDLFLETCIH